MELDLIRKNDIIEYAKKAPTFFESDIPVTIERAVSQSNNPDALEEDILLIVAREGKKLLSFIGVYPGIVQNNPKNRIYWISCWWKAPGVSSEISSLVLNKYLQFAGDKAGVPHLPPHIIKVLEKNSILVKGRDGLMLRFRSAMHSRSLQRSMKGKFHKSINVFRKAGVLKLMDLIINSLKTLRLTTDSNMQNKDFYVFSEVPGEDYFTFIQKNFQHYITLPHRRNIEWIINYPWLVKPGNANDEILKKYHFSYVSENFHHFFPVLKKKGAIVAAGFFSSREGAVKSLFVFVEKAYEDEFFSGIMQFIQHNKEYHTIISYEKPFVEFLERKLKKKLHLEPVRRFMGTGNKKYFDLEPTDADGDSCFT